MWPSLLLNTAHGFLWHSNFLNPSPVLDVSWAGSRRLTGNIFLLHAFLFHCFSNTGCTYYWAISCVRCGVGAQCCRDYPGLQHKGLMWWVLCLHAVNCVRYPVLQRLSPSPSPGVDVMNVVFACCVYTKNCHLLQYGPHGEWWAESDSDVCPTTDHARNSLLPSEFMLLVNASCLWCF